MRMKSEVIKKKTYGADAKLAEAKMAKGRRSTREGGQSECVNLAKRR